MMRIIPVASFLLLSGCGETQSYPVEVSVPQPPANIMTRCEDLPPLLVSPVTMGKLLEHDAIMVSLYVECAIRDGAKANWIDAVTATPY